MASTTLPDGGLPSLRRPFRSGVIHVTLAVLLGFLAALAVLRAGPVLAASPDACGSLQALVDGAADGATVTVPPCVYRETVAITRPVTLDGTGSVIDGDGVRPYWVTVRADDVTLIGFTMRNAAPADPQAGSLDVQDVERFTGRDLQLTGGSYAGVRLWFTRDARLEDVDVSGSRGLGVIGWEAHRTSVVGGHVNANDTAGYDSEYEAGGLKFGKSDDVTIEDVEVDHNVGPGVWCDVECHRFTVRDSRIHHNDRMGVLFEISTDATIEDNQIWENGWGDPAWGWGGGVVISSSGGATVVIARAFYQYGI